MFVAVNRYIPFAFIKAKVSIVILIYSAMSDARLSSLSVIHIHTETQGNDLNDVISVFAGSKDRRLTLCL